MMTSTDARKDLPGRPPESDNSPHLLEQQMRLLEQDLQAMQVEWGDAAEQLTRTTANIGRISAPQRLMWKHMPPSWLAGTKLTKEDLDALLLDWLWTDHTALMEEQLNAEALCAAFSTRYKVGSTALSSKQTRLNADIKLHGQGH